MAQALNIMATRCPGTFQPSPSLISVNVFAEEASYAPSTCIQYERILAVSLNGEIERDLTVLPSVAGG